MLIKASDGLYVTWNVVIDDNKLDDILDVPTNSVIEVTEASIQNGFRLAIHEYNVIDDKVNEEICLEDELLFLEKSWYLETFKKKGMVDQRGGRNLHHPDFQTTPLKMMTRSKAKIMRKDPTNGFPCDNCGKKFKTQKTLEMHINKYHQH